MTEWIKCTIGDVCSTISETYKGNSKKVVLVNTSDVLEGEILNHKKVDNKDLKGQFKKTFEKDDILYSEIRPANKRYGYVDFSDTENYIASTKLMVIRANNSAYGINHCKKDLRIKLNNRIWLLEYCKKVWYNRYNDIKEVVCYASKCKYFF